jgi:hypothetical protein
MAIDHAEEIAHLPLSATEYVPADPTFVSIYAAFVGYEDGFHIVRVTTCENIVVGDFRVEYPVDALLAAWDELP